MGSLSVDVTFKYGIYGSSITGFYCMYTVGGAVCSRDLGYWVVKQSVENNSADSE